MKNTLLRTSVRFGLLLFSLVALQTKVSATNYLVSYGAYFFSPPVINIQVGDSITWSNTSSGIPHTVTGLSTEAMCGTATFSTMGAGCTHTFLASGSFPYQCNFHSFLNMTGLVNVASVVVPPPTISITNPTNGAVFSAPANVSITTTTGGGTVTNVSFFAGTNALGSVTNTPFTLQAGNLAAGAYALTAVASAGGVSATSAVVNITAVTPLPVSVTTSGISNGNFSFSYTANPGLSYVIQDSLDLTTWMPLATNVASSNPSAFTDTFSTNGPRFYRVGLLPNP